MSQSTSEPESIDLSYDMWAGQFEFVGPTSNINSNSINKNSSLNKSTESLEDLNLGCYNCSMTDKPILIDQETFLSLNPNDFDGISSSGPNSMVFIENRLNSFETSTPPTNDTNNKLNFELNNNSGNYKNGGGFKLEKLKNFKNKFFNELSKEKTIEKDIDGKLNNNGISVKICDNLNEQLDTLEEQVSKLKKDLRYAEEVVNRTRNQNTELTHKYNELEDQHMIVQTNMKELIKKEEMKCRKAIKELQRKFEYHEQDCNDKLKEKETSLCKLRSQVDRFRKKYDEKVEEVTQANYQLNAFKEEMESIEQELADARSREIKYEEDKRSSDQLITELRTELERARAAPPSSSPPSPGTVTELQKALNDMLARNRALEEANQENQALYRNDLDLLNEQQENLRLELQLERQIQEKDEENYSLRQYIDRILLNIIDNYPQLLEVDRV